MATKKVAAKKTAAKKTAGKKAAVKSMPKAGKDPKGGLTVQGRKFFKEKEGSNLKPGVKGAADTPEKMKRKGSFLTRHFTNPSGPMEKDGEPTRLALSAQAWGEPMPKTEGQAKKLAAKGRELLDEFHKATGTKAAKKSVSSKKAK